LVFIMIFAFVLACLALFHVIFQKDNQKPTGYLNCGRIESINKYYELGNVLGKGATSEVRLCKEKASGHEYAVKVIAKQSNLDKKRAELILTEITILQRTRHVNIVSLVDVFENASHVFIIMENISGGELFERIVQLTHYSEKDASRVMGQVLSAVQHLHQNLIVHRDLKPENLLLASKSPSSDVKVTDFGLAAVFKSDTMKMNVAVGTPTYVAPEILRLIRTGEPYGKEVDLWSLGVILYILLCGFTPFQGAGDEEIFEQIYKADYSFPSPFWDKISTNAKDLITNLLVLDPKLRLTAQEALQHPWFRDNATEDHLAETIAELKKFNAKRKFAGAIHAVKAMNKFHRFGNQQFTKNQTP